MVGSQVPHRSWEIKTSSPSLFWNSSQKISRLSTYVSNVDLRIRSEDLIPPRQCSKNNKETVQFILIVSYQQQLLIVSIENSHNKLAMHSDLLKLNSTFQKFFVQQFEAPVTIQLKYQIVLLLSLLQNTNYSISVFLQQFKRVAYHKIKLEV
ncbi:Hypothetical_protein [Hexamita inflata]|uniref:Hypothetical_protein n=1 Tax=Hexamita inflata TaxID=28002 RepID=A0AA86RPU2_9EUKA|nr:Hypothetical protein HINF_LOCUS66101 [Hexamita inflata]